MAEQRWDTRRRRWDADAWDAWPRPAGGRHVGEEPPAGDERAREFDPFGYGYGAHGTAGYSGDLGVGWRDFESRGSPRTQARGDWLDDDGARDFVADAREPDRRSAFVGRGPKGYRRSDARIAEDVNEALTRDPHIDATDVEVLVEGGEVTLSGQVDGRGQKRHAERVAERVEGVVDVHNRIRIAPTS